MKLDPESMGVNNPDWSEGWERDMVAQFTPMVWRIARDYFPKLMSDASGNDVADLAALGFQGVVYACRNHRPNKAKICTYVGHCIRWAILSVHRESNGLIRLPIEKVKNGTEWPTVMRLSPGNVESLAEDQVCEEMIAESPREDEGVREAVVDRAEALLSHLLPGQRRIVEEIVFRDRNMAEIARERGCSRSNVSSVYRRSLARMRRMAEGAASGG